MEAHDATRTVDVVLDAPASVSIYLQALEQAGRRAEATAVVRAHDAAAREASVLLADTAGWATTQEVGVPAPHRYEPTAIEINTVLHGLPDHSTLHSHLVVAGRADVTELRRRLASARSSYERRLGDTLTSELGLRLAVNAGALELAGVPIRLVESFDSLPCLLRAGAAQLRAPSRSSVWS